MTLLAIHQPSSRHIPLLNFNTTYVEIKYAMVFATARGDVSRRKPSSFNTSLASYLCNTPSLGLF